MLEIKVTDKTCPAVDMKFEQLFYDGDGDLFYRCFEGAVMLEGFEGDPAELSAYSDEELTDYDKFPFLKQCKPVKGKVTLKVKIKGHN